MGCSGVNNVEEFSKPVTDSNFEKSIITIENEGRKGSGFLCKISIPETKNTLPVLITSIDLIGKKEIETPKKIEINLDNNTYVLNTNEKRKTFINEDKYKISIIEIKDEDNLNADSFFEIEEEEELIKKIGTVGLLINNNGKNIECFICKIKNFKENGYNFEYDCKNNNNNDKFIGNPIINMKNNKLIGIQTSPGIGTLLINPIKEFIEKNTKEEEENKNIFKSFNSMKTVKSTIRISRTETHKELFLTYFVPNFNYINVVKIFGETFVKNNKDKCKLILYDEEKDEEFNCELCVFLELELINKFNHGDKFFNLYLVQTDNFTDLSSMFYQCATLIRVEGLNGLNTEKLTSMAGMFESCSLLQEIDISYMKIPQVEDISYMFRKCTFLQSLDFSGWKTSNIKSTKAMFEFCESLEEITGLDNWDVSNLKDSSFMFNYCKKLTKIEDLSNWNTINLTTISNMFKGMESIISFPDISNWKTSKLTDMSLTFSYCTSVTSFPDISNWDTKNVELIPLLFVKCCSLKSLPDISKWNTSKITDFSHIFGECHSLISVPDISKWDTSNAIKLRGIFHQCYSLKSIPDISNWSLKKTVDISGMFNHCRIILSLPDISKWDISNVKIMNNLFCNVLSVTNLPK